MAELITLIDETGRILRDDKRGAINHKTANILVRLHISEESWLKLTTDFEGYSQAPSAQLSIYVNSVNM